MEHNDLSAVHNQPATDNYPEPPETSPYLFV